MQLKRFLMIKHKIIYFSEEKEVRMPYTITKMNFSLLIDIWIVAKWIFDPVSQLDQYCLLTWDSVSLIPTVKNIHNDWLNHMILSFANKRNAFAFNWQDLSLKLKYTNSLTQTWVSYGGLKFRVTGRQRWIPHLHR